ncbi:Rrf2 family transcriptional regulator [Lactobacillus sp. LC28-10]|uniref:Rrf2 family transcriptional regulator n=1 Tax=Secundilactobacillus angelensis TaxID=2722706 RepID=A0ABX1KXL2_9LACO|nr:Rrf2 family transcriptional regulator [Secundilactobacillus angelensis]MCH5462962.1 Rrf2 family transcriptional regulator [Secundilactobacillus angelensis]NLR18687.1 Rrf2 family transcriptional regulator [Secundilactobacillus angelensis]
MKYSHKLSDAVHILAYVDIFQNDGDLSSNRIARSIESNPSLVRRLMSALVKAGLLVTQPGVAAPSLSKPTAKISLLEVYNAVEDDRNLLHVDEKTNPDCPVGANIQAALNDAYAKVQAQAEKSMAEITLDQIVDDIQVRRLNTSSK